MRSLLRFWPDVKPKLGIYLLVFILTVIAQAVSLIAPILTGQIIDGPITRGQLHGLWWPVAGVLCVGVVEAVALFFRRWLIAPVVSQWEVTWRARIYNRLQFISVAKHDSWESGQLLSRAVNDLSQLRRFASFGLPFLITTPLVIIIGTLMLTMLEPIFGLIVLVTAVPIAITAAIFEQKYRLASRSAQDTMGEIATAVEESVQGIRILKSFGRAPWVQQRFMQISRRLQSLEVRKANLDAVLWSTLLCVPLLSQGAILAVGTWGVVAGWTTIGTVVAAVTITMFLRIPIEMFGFLLSDALMSMTAAARYWEVMDTEYDITDADGGLELDPQPGSYRGEVELAEVSFQFADAAQPVLAGVNMQIAPGQTVALVGATGSGKTALAALLPRLHDPSSGAVRIDGTDIRDLPVAEVRRIVSVAFEEPILFSASVADNVRMGKPEASDAEVFEALRIASAADFVAKLPAGADTMIGEQGLSLSGGQRQRLALARAIIGKPRVLVLDDPLSAVDVDTEDRVHRELREVLAASTTLVIAHRPSTAALADHVVVLVDGTVAAQGTHVQLLAESPVYRDLMGAPMTRRSA